MHDTAGSVIDASCTTNVEGQMRRLVRRSDKLFSVLGRLATLGVLLANIAPTTPCSDIAVLPAAKYQPQKPPGPHHQSAIIRCARHVHQFEYSNPNPGSQ